MVGRSASDVFDAYRAKASDPATIRLNWQSHLTNPNLSVGTLSAVLGEFEPSSQVKRTVPYRGISYDGEIVVTDTWLDELGSRLAFDNHFRLVFLLQDSVDVTPDMLQDDRILVFVPGSLSDKNRKAVTDILALNGMVDDFRHRQDDEALRVKQFIDSRHSDLRNDLLMAQWDFYKRGRIISRQQTALNPDNLFSSAADLMGRVVTQLFDALFVDRPIGSFRRNRSMNLNTETSRVFTGLWEREPATSVRDALENFAVGLGLAQAENPLRYDPSNSGAFDIIRSMYEAAQTAGKSLRVPDVYEQLARIGIPARLATLYLLCYVRSNPDVELLLKSGHNIRLTNGSHLSGDSIHSNIVPRVVWNNRAFATAGHFDVLTERRGPVWNDCLEWTRKFDPELKTAADPDHVTEQTRQMVTALAAEQERLRNAMNQIRQLEVQLHCNIPHSLKASADLVDGLTTSISSLEDFMAKVHAANLASADDLGNAVTDVHNLCQLGQMAVEIMSTYTYLSNVPVHKLEGAFDKLAEDRATLLGDMDLNSLAATPQRWSHIRERFGTWKRIYIREYRKFHRDFHVEISEIVRRFSEIDHKLVALENIEQMEHIAHTHSAPPLRSQLESMRGNLEICEPGIESGVLETTPYCTQCDIRTGDTSKYDPSALDGQITDALGEFIATLKSDTVDKAMAASESPIISALRAALTDDTENVVTILEDKGNVDLLEGVLKGESGSLIIVRNVSIIDEISKEYPTVSQETIQEVVDRFRELMEEALRTQQEDVGPGVKVEVRLR